MERVGTDNSPGAEALSVWEDSSGIPWERDLVALFVKNQIKVIAAMPVLAALCALVSLQWTTPFHALAWFLAAITCQAMQFHLCRRYQAEAPGKSHHSEWIGMFAASEFLIGACWSLPLFVYWDASSDIQHIYLVATSMAVTAVRIMMASNFMPVVIAGTGFITFNVAIRCLMEADPLYTGLGAMAIALEVFFIQLSMRLQETARDMLIFKSQRETLIDELKREREAAEAAQHKAEDASKAKSQFLATMSHELRTPLNAIMGFSEIMSSELFGKHRIDAYKAYSNDIHSSGNYLLALVNDILDLSRIEAGRKDLDEEPFSVAELLEDVAHIMEPRAKEKGLAIVCAPAPGLPKLLADRRAASQILLNLATNAVKFTPSGGRVTLRAALGGGGDIMLSVVDNGPGIPEQELGQIMGAFNRGSHARKKAIDGAGLGLSIVNGLAGLHGAKFELNSVHGAGTEARVTFPAARVLSGPRGEVMAAAGVQTSSQRKLISLTG
jgi:two-component system, cell cycle sensor histidine kinase PleC